VPEKIIGAFNVKEVALFNVIKLVDVVVALTVLV
jgi:hypothetical protein